MDVQVAAVVPDVVYSYIVGNGEPTSILECLIVGDPYSHQRFPLGFSLTNALPMPSELVSSTMLLRLINIGWSNLTSVKSKASMSTNALSFSNGRTA